MADKDFAALCVRHLPPPPNVLGPIVLAHVLPEAGGHVGSVSGNLQEKKGKRAMFVGTHHNTYCGAISQVAVKPFALLWGAYHLWVLLLLLMNPYLPSCPETYIPHPRYSGSVSSRFQPPPGV